MKYFYLLLLIVITSCAHRNYSFEDENEDESIAPYDSLYERYDYVFEEFMTDYYRQHDSYPKSKEEYLLNAYRDDSINNFEFFTGFLYINSCDSIFNFKKLSKYPELDSLTNALSGVNSKGAKYISFDKIVLNYNVYNEIRGAISSWYPHIFPSWCTFYKNNSLVVEENDSLLFYINEEWKENYDFSFRRCRKATYLLNLYLQNPNDWNEDNKRIVYARKDGDIGVYCNYAPRIIDLMKYTRIYKREKNSYVHRIKNSSVPKELFAIVEEEFNKAAGEKTDSTHEVDNFVRYDRENGMSDYVTKRSLPSSLKDNKTLNDALNKILDSVDADYMYLYVVTNE